MDHLLDGWLPGLGDGYRPGVRVLVGAAACCLGGGDGVVHGASAVPYRPSGPEGFCEGLRVQGRVRRGGGPEGGQGHVLGDLFHSGVHVRAPLLRSPWMLCPAGRGVNRGGVPGRLGPGRGVSWARAGSGQFPCPAWQPSTTPGPGARPSGDHRGSPVSSGR